MEEKVTAKAKQRAVDLGVYKVCNLGYQLLTQAEIYQTKSSFSWSLLKGSKILGSRDFQNQLIT